MVDVDIHSFRATDLSPETSYEISVVAIDANGNELGNKVSITATTTKTPEVVNVLDYGVTYTEGYTEYNDEINAISKLILRLFRLLLMQFLKVAN